jgi:hypothetical protein
MMQALPFVAFVYFGIVFVIAFGLGVLRVTILAPQFGTLTAVALEVPVILAICWTVAGWIARWWSRPQLQQLAMGLLAFAMLITAEIALSTLLLGQSLRQFLVAIATAPGAMGLAGQIGFALIPALRGQIRG